MTNLQKSKVSRELTKNININYNIGYIKTIQTYRHTMSRLAKHLFEEADVQRFEMF